VNNAYKVSGRNMSNGVPFLTFACGSWFMRRDDKFRENRLVSPDAGMTIDGAEEYVTHEIARTAVMEYLIRSYGPIFVEELIKHLPQFRSETPEFVQE
jgi:hypothetical protein